jgi:putative membrane protein
MRGFERFGPHMGPDWWPFVGWLVPMVLLLVLIGIGVWAVVRLTGRPQHRGADTAGPAGPPAVHRDGALEEVRLRYARGEIDRDEFLQRTSDLTGAAPPPA